MRSDHRSSKVTDPRGKNPTCDAESEDTLGIKPLTRSINPYWTDESRQATEALMDITSQDLEVGVAILDDLFQKYLTEKTEGLNSLISSMFCVADGHPELGAHLNYFGETNSLILAGKLRWKFFNACLLGINKFSDLEMVYDSGATRALIRKTAIQRIYEDLQEQNFFGNENFDSEELKSGDYALLVTSVASLSPFLFSQILSELSEELTEYAPVAPDCYPACDGLAEIYVSIASLGRHEHTSVVDHLVSIAKNSDTRGAEFCGRVLARIVEHLGGEKAAFDLCFEELENTSDPKAKKNLAAFTSEFCLYDPDRAIDCVQATSRLAHEASEFEAPYFLLAGARVLEAYDFALDAFGGAYELLLNSLSELPTEFLDAEGQRARDLLVESSTSILRGAKAAEVVQHITMECLCQIEWPGCCAHTHFKETLAALFTNHPQSALEACIDYYSINPLTPRMIECLDDVMMPALTSHKVSPELLSSLCLALGRTEAIDYVEGDAQRMEFLEKIRRLRNYLHDFSVTEITAMPAFSDDIFWETNLSPQDTIGGIEE